MQEVPWEEIDVVRSRELALVRPARAQQWRGSQEGSREPSIEPSRRRFDDPYVEDGAYDDDRDKGYVVRRRTVRDHGRVPDARELNTQLVRREQQTVARRAENYSDSESDSSRERRDRRRRRRERADRHKDAQPDAAAQRQQDDGHICWYSGKSRHEAHPLERHLDPSYDGIIAAAAGAAIGAMTARRFGGKEKRGLKIIGGTIAGALVVNAAEHKFKVFVEEQEEQIERKEKKVEAEARQY